MNIMCLYSSVKDAGHTRALHQPSICTRMEGLGDQRPRKVTPNETRVTKVRFHRFIQVTSHPPTPIFICVHGTRQKIQLF